MYVKKNSCKNGRILLALTHGYRENGLKNLGYVIFEKLYHELGIHTFFQRHENRLKIDFNLNAIFRLLVYSRILDPGSKKQAYDQQAPPLKIFYLIARSLLDSNQSNTLNKKRCTESAM